MSSQEITLPDASINLSTQEKPAELSNVAISEMKNLNNLIVEIYHLKN